MTAKEAFEKSFISYDRCMAMISEAVDNNETRLGYVHINEETRHKLKELGYKVSYPVGGALVSKPNDCTTISWENA